MSETSYEWVVYDQVQDKPVSMVWDNLDSAEAALYDWRKDCPHDDLVLKKRLVVRHPWK